VVGTVELDGAIDVIHQIEAMFGQEGKYTVEALLKMTLRIDQAVK